MSISPPTDELIRVRRAPKRGSLDRGLIHDILDAGLLCHLGYLHGGRPVVVPTLYGRDDDHLVVHGSAASRAMRAARDRLPVCVTVTVLDALVLARSAMHHSANYRSVVVHGEAEAITQRDEKVAALRTLTEHVSPGRWDDGIRAPDERELAATEVLRLPLTHAVAKVRDGGVNDDADDLDREVWAGVVPVVTSWATPLPDAGTEHDVAPVAGFPDWSARSTAGTPTAPSTVAPAVSPPRSAR